MGETIVGGIRPSRSVAIEPYTVNQTLTLCSVSDISLRDSRKRTCTRYGESRVSPGGDPCMAAIDPSGFFISLIQTSPGHQTMVPDDSSLCQSYAAMSGPKASCGWEVSAREVGHVNKNG